MVLIPLVLAAVPVHAESPDTALSLTPNALNIEIKKDSQNKLQEARLHSGLGLKFRSDLLQFAVDYKANVQLKDEATNALFSQQVGASLHSNTLNQMLGLDAAIRTGSTIKQGGDAYVHSVTPGFSKSFSNMAKLSVQYEYLLNKANSEAMRKEKTGYRMRLSGKARQGRVTWKGNYRTADVFGGAWRLQSTELLEFESRLQLVPELRLVLSGRNKDEVHYDAGLAQDIFNETRYGAGLAWSPSQYYSVAFKLNKLSETRTAGDEFFSSGTVSWYPRNDMELTFSYGDRLIKGARAFMLNTRIDLSGS